MRQKDFPPAVKKLALKRAKHRCERCGSPRNLEFHHIKPLSLGGKSVLDNCVVICHHCHNIAPRDPFLLKSYFLRFASVKEMIKHYNVNNEKDAIVSLSEELKVSYKELKRKIENDPLSHTDTIKYGMKRVVKQRGHAGFNIPYGYNYKNNKLTINPDEMKVIKDIYSWYISGKSMVK